MRADGIHTSAPYNIIAITIPTNTVFFTFAVACFVPNRSFLKLPNIPLAAAMRARMAGSSDKDQWSLYPRYVYSCTKGINLVGSDESSRGDWRGGGKGTHY